MVPRRDAKRVMRGLTQNPMGKPTYGQTHLRITLRRVLQMFEEIEVLLLATESTQQRLILNLMGLYQRILELLGRHVQQCYQFV